MYKFSNLDSVNYGNFDHKLACQNIGFLHIQLHYNYKQNSKKQKLLIKMSITENNYC